MAYKWYIVCIQKTQASHTYSNDNTTTNTKVENKIRNENLPPDIDDDSPQIPLTAILY